MQIEVARWQGFCFGVRDAVRAIDEMTGTQGHAVATLGQVVHNPGIIERQASQGATVIETLAAAQERAVPVVITAHGVGPRVYDETRARNLEVIDTTCILVKRVHEVVKEWYNEGFQILVFGDARHPEVRGIVGWTDNTAIVQSHRGRR